MSRRDEGLKKLQKIYTNAGNAVLIVVDVQNEFCKPAGKMYSETCDCIMAGVTSAMQDLISKAHGEKIPVIYIQSVRTLEEPEIGVFNVRPILKLGTWNSEIIDEIKPESGDTIVQKFSHDPFFKPDLDNVLKKLVPDPTHCYAIVVGGVTNVCVYHTVMGLHVRDYWVVVPVDCIYYMDEAGHKRGLDQFSESGPYPNVFLSRSDLIEISHDAALADSRPVPGS
jgi:ureidoacrylate peracid hydrolase